MKAADLRDLDTTELHQQIAELKEELFNLRFQLATGQLDNHRRMREVKREAARIRTVLRERDFAEATQRFTESAPAEPAATAEGPAPVEEPEPTEEETS